MNHQQNERPDADYRAELGLTGRASITVAECATPLGMSQRHLSEMIRRGEFPPHRRVGRRVVIAVPHLLDWLRSNG